MENTRGFVLRGECVQLKEEKKFSLHRPATRFLLCGIEIENIFKVVQTKHLLIQCVQLYTALKVGQSERGWRLKADRRYEEYQIQHLCAGVEK